MQDSTSSPSSNYLPHMVGRLGGRSPVGTQVAEIQKVPFNQPQPTTRCLHLSSIPNEPEEEIVTCNNLVVDSPRKVSTAGPISLRQQPIKVKFIMRQGGGSITVWDEDGNYLMFWIPFETTFIKNVPNGAPSFVHQTELNPIGPPKLTPYSFSQKM